MMTTFGILNNISTMILSQPTSSSPSSSSSFSLTSTSSSLSLPYKYQFHTSHSPSFITPTTPTTTKKLSKFISSSSCTIASFSISKLSTMPTQTTKSGFCPLSQRNSWMQENSTCYNISTNSGCRPLHSVFPTAPAVVSSVEDLYEYICSGPLIEKLSLTPKMLEDNIERWIECGLHLCKLFRINELNMTIAQKARLFHYYVPVFLWCEDQISQHRSKFKDGQDIPPLLIGFSAPQGCGKTTLVFALDYLFRLSGRKSATVSIDDFYLTAEDQAKMREQNPGNTLLELRGNAGSHDLPLSVETLQGLTEMTKKGMKMKLPRYNKSAYGGKGDRADPSTWPEVKGPLTVVLFEGWMLGFKPVPNEVVKAVDPQLEVVNRNLEAYYDAWDKFINAWIVIKIKEPSCVYQWRLQAEIAMREEGKPGMSDEEVRDFVSRYFPAYKAYLPTLYSEGPLGSDPEHLLVVDIDDERNPILGN
ncbi:hypothetical protein IFM89_032674 [Coptis chinensis]|uniref:D-glycerate 3-kinase, chloroplastic n=1 Tax=Coptis chinensis TaxID=261450 RepID=A0A835M7R1_9MAGN|nr:hypothetical protein IFM89_032674 [Coptis chinensis]